MDLLIGYCSSQFRSDSGINQYTLIPRSPSSPPLFNFTVFPSLFQSIICKCCCASCLSVSFVVISVVFDLFSAFHEIQSLSHSKPLLPSSLETFILSLSLILSSDVDDTAQKLIDISSTLSIPHTLSSSLSNKRGEKE